MGVLKTIIYIKYFMRKTTGQNLLIKDGNLTKAYSKESKRSFKGEKLFQLKGI